MPKRTSTTKDIALLQQLYKQKQMRLSPEFQRNSVWPTAAKAYLIDTILSDRPIPLLFFQRDTSPQTGRPVYDVIDGQQRLRAIFEFLENRIRLTESSDPAFRNKRFQDLSPEGQSRVLNYDLIVEEISGYSEPDIQDMFVRMNRYVVRLSPQELRHAQHHGAFKNFAEKMGRKPFWKTQKIFSDLQVRRMRPVEFAAELVILLLSGPQDKKSSVELYYGHFQKAFPAAKMIAARLESYIRWIKQTLPDLSEHRYHRPVDFYSLVGAIDLISEKGRLLSRIRPTTSREQLLRFEKETRQKEPSGLAAEYVVAASRQTDNIGPRIARIEILASLLNRA